MNTSGRPIVYITRDIERALGTPPGQHYRIITNRTEYAENVQTQFPGYVTLIDSTVMLDTAELMEHEVTLETLAHLDTDIVVFKNTLRIEEIANAHSWKLLNPSAALGEKVENKISQVAWLGTIAEEWLPPHQVIPAKDIIFKDQPLIVQWAHGHTGDSTILVTSDKDLVAIREKFPERLARVTTFINGPSFTVNVVVGPALTLVGNVSYQITGLAPFTEKKFTTVGNDWSASATLLSESELEQISRLGAAIGEKLRTDGWRGLFGLDIIRDDERGRLFLIEINARQPASTTYESFLQDANRRLGIPGHTTFEAHLAALRGEDTAGPLIEINDGAQVIQRITSAARTPSSEAVATLSSAGYNVITYTNTEENADLIRIQSARGIMESHNTFNARGKEISESLKKA